MPELQGWLFLRSLLPSESLQTFAEQVRDYTNLHFDFNAVGPCEDRNDTSIYGTTCAESLVYCEKTGINWHSPYQTNPKACPVTCGTCDATPRGPLSADRVDLTYSIALHDAVMLYAHAATKVLSEGGNLKDGQAVTAAVRSTTFEGVGTSKVALTNNGDRIESYEVMNYVVDSDGAMGSVAVGVFNSTLEEYVASSQVLLWPGSTLEVPVDFSVADKPIHFALLLPLTGSWTGGRQIAGAAALAAERVNADESLLPGRTLEYSWADSGCSAKQGLAAMGELLGGKSRIDAVIGPGCSSACEVTSHLSAGQNIPQISYSCTSPTLSDQSEHPLVRVAWRLACACVSTNAWHARRRVDSPD